ncbi:MAG: ATP-binding protein [Verrucomicrobiota bacterium]
MGPRGVGKTAWLRTTFPNALFFDLLDGRTYQELLAAPDRLGARIPECFADWVIVDEVQRVPELLNEVHRLIEGRRLKFVLTGSSARKLRGRGVNLLAGRALTRHLHPLTAAELGNDFDLGRSLRWGGLPQAWTSPAPADFLSAYVHTYLREQVLQEGLTRNIAAFARFLEAASFSPGGVLNMAAVARECGISAKAAENWFTVLEDLLIGVRIPTFARRAKRRLVMHPKFYLFDAGVFQAVRPRGPLDVPESIHGPALETLFLQHLRAVNDYLGLGYAVHYWRTPAGDEVDFVVYGPRGMCAFEVKLTSRVRSDDLKSLRVFRDEYPMARAWLIHAGRERGHDSGVDVLPATEALPRLAELLLPSPEPG